MRKAEIIILILLCLSFITAIYFYPLMPDRMASHWNSRGEVNRYLPKFLALFLMPSISLIIFFLYLLIPKIDPLKENIEKFRKYFDRFVILILLFLFYLYLLTIFWNLGMRFNIGKVLAPALAILFYYCGVLTENTKRNWFIGIRTPWTLSSDEVWQKTHKISGRLFKITGIFTFLSLFFETYALFLIVVLVVSIGIYSVIYSYIQYRKEVG
jgi:uncharacterized membrane protein